MKAIVLAAGQGARLRPLTDDRPKCMVAYKGVPLIDRILASLRQAGISDIVVIKGYMADALQPAWVRTYVNPNYATGNMVATLFTAEAELEGDVVISYSDIAYGPDVVRALVRADSDVAIVVDRAWRDLWAQRMPDPLADAETLKLDGAGFVRELGKKPRGYADIEGQYIGLIKLSAAGARALRTLYASLDRNALYDGQSFEKMYMTSLLQLAIDSGIPVKAAVIEGGWIEIDAPSDLDLDVAV
jgi:L-glutamine-phosphate cytidylyltransferase